MEALTAPRLFGVSLLQVANLASYVIFIFTSAIGGAGLFGVPRIGETSNELPVQVTPAGYAFSIWSLIFVLLGVLTLLQLLPQNREWSASKLGLWWVANAALGEGLWPFAFSLRWGGMWVSAFILLLIVATAAGMYLAMDVGVAPLAGGAGAEEEGKGGCAARLRRATPPVSLVELLCQAGVAIYTGWTTAATILNFSIALQQAGVEEGAGAPGSVAVTVAAAALAVLGAATRTDFFFAGTLCWALSAIHVNQARSGSAPQAALDASLAAAGVAGAAAGAALLWRAGMLFLGRWQLAPPSLQLGGSGAAGSAGKGGLGSPAANDVVVTQNVAVVAWK
jgi:benzodiazapine receptor